MASTYNSGIADGIALDPAWGQVVNSTLDDKIGRSTILGSVGNITVTEGSPTYLTRSSGSWITDGVLVGDKIQIIDNAFDHNSLTYSGTYTVASIISATQIQISEVIAVSTYNTTVFSPTIVILHSKSSIILPSYPLLPITIYTNLDDWEAMGGTWTLNNATGTDTGVSYWTSAGGGVGIRLKSSISIPNGITKIRLRVLLRASAISLSSSIKYSLNGSAKVTVFTTTNTPITPTLDGSSTEIITDAVSVSSGPPTTTNFPRDYIRYTIESGSGGVYIFGIIIEMW